MERDRPSAKTVVLRRAVPPDGQRREGSEEMRQHTTNISDSGSSAFDRLTIVCHACRSRVGRLTTLRVARLRRDSAILTRVGGRVRPALRPPLVVVHNANRVTSSPGQPCKRSHRTESSQLFVYELATVPTFCERLLPFVGGKAIACVQASAALSRPAAS